MRSSRREEEQGGQEEKVGDSDTEGQAARSGR